ncbi:MAG: hypothetical protein ABL931_00400 [Usitatibacteraceae bacterium]
MSDSESIQRHMLLIHGTLDADLQRYCAFQVDSYEKLGANPAYRQLSVSGWGLAVDSMFKGCGKLWNIDSQVMFV